MLVNLTVAINGKELSRSTPIKGGYQNLETHIEIVPFFEQLFFDLQLLRYLLPVFLHAYCVARKDAGDEFVFFVFVEGLLDASPKVSKAPLARGLPLIDNHRQKFRYRLYAAGT